MLDVGEGGPQPALQRLQVHLCGRDRGHAGAFGRWHGRAAHRARHRQRDRRGRAAAPVRALPPRRGRPRPHASKAAASGSPWCRNWSGCTAARSRVESGPGRAAVHRRACRSAARTCPPNGSAPGARSPTPRARRGLCRGGAALAAATPSSRGQPRSAPSDVARCGARRAASACCSPTTMPTCATTCAPARQRRLRRRGRGRRRGGARGRARAHARLVLADVMMPSLDGFGLIARAARRSGAARHARACCCRRAPARKRGSRARAGADDYLTKPFSARELLARVAGQPPARARPARRARGAARGGAAPSRRSTASAPRSPPSSTSSAPCRSVTDAATELTGAAFGAFFYNVIDDKRRSLHALHPVRRAARGVREASRCRATPRSSRRPSAATASCAPTTSRRPALRPERAPPRHARGPPAGAQLSRRAGGLALRRGAGRPVLRPSAARRVHRARRARRRRHRRAGRGRDRQRAALPRGADASPRPRLRPAPTRRSSSVPTSAASGSPTRSSALPAARRGR